MRLIIFITALFMVGCTQDLKRQVEGEWTMHAVIQQGEDVSNEHDPYDERYFIMKQNGTFESGGRPFEKNTGKYILNEEEKTLFLDSDVGPEDDSNWKISVNNDTMYWKGYGTEWAEEFRIVLVRDFSIIPIIINK